MVLKQLSNDISNKSKAHVFIPHLGVNEVIYVVLLALSITTLSIMTLGTIY